MNNELRERLLRRRRGAGVTLVEVLIVVAIMAMLSGGIAFALLPKMNETRLKTAKQGAQEIRKIVQLYQTEGGTDCPSLSALKKGGYLDKASNTDDPWGKKFTIRCEDDDIYVTSSGPDAKRGTKDDIMVPSGDAEAEEEDE
jgi:general secretion pathway protein G